VFVCIRTYILTQNTLARSHAHTHNSKCILFSLIFLELHSSEIKTRIKKTPNFRLKRGWQHSTPNSKKHSNYQTRRVRRRQARAWRVKTKNSRQLLRKWGKSRSVRSWEVSRMPPQKCAHKFAKEPYMPAKKPCSWNFTAISLPVAAATEVGKHAHSQIMGGNRKQALQKSPIYPPKTALYIRTKEPYIWAPKTGNKLSKRALCMCTVLLSQIKKHLPVSKEPYTSTKEPYISATKEPYVCAQCCSVKL